MKLGLALAAAAALALAPGAHAAFPGANGDIAFNWTFGCDGSMVAAMSPDGSGVRLLTADACVEDGPPRAAFPDWSADGERILFVSGNRLATMAADGSGEAPLPLTTSGDPGRPSLSPDGRRVAFARVHGGRQWIYTARLDGTGLRRLRAGSGPRWSPGGRRIAYVSPTGTLVVASAGGAIRRRPASGALTVDWSPDGRRLLFSTRRRLALRVVSADWRGRARALLPRVTGAFSPVWSPDGRRIAYVRGLPAGEEELRLGVYTARVNGGRPRRIFRTGEERIEETLEPLTLSWGVRPPAARGSGG
jgi:Tol biopolymer transport system component